jgi:uncharacterized phiE125 gp8 family phage protein
VGHHGTGGLFTFNRQMYHSYKITTAPTSEPITLAEAKAQLRVESDFSDDDTWITTAITVVREQVEALTNRALMPQSLELAIGEFEDVMQLPKPPFTSLTSIQYYDEDNSIQTLASSVYTLNDFVDPAEIALAYEQTWPTVYDRPDAIRIAFDTGYADAASVPASVKQAMLMLLTDLYDNRSASTSNFNTVKVNWTPAVLNLLSTTKAFLY